jgi:predicted ester cyclase
VADELNTDLKLRTQILYDMFTSGNFDGIEHLVSPYMVIHGASYGPGVRGPRLYRNMIESFREAFSDIELTIVEMIEDGDRVAVRFHLSGTHTGDFSGVPPTNRSFRITAFDIVRFEGGQAVEHWGQSDDLSMLQQLGLLQLPSS